MNPHDLIRKGIEYNDMDLVRQGYELLNGQPSTNVESQPPVENFQASRLKSEPSPVILDEHPPQPQRGQEFAFQIRQQGDNRERAEGGTYTRSEPIDTQKVHDLNMFVDDLTEEVKHTKAEQAKRSGGNTLYVAGRVPRKKAPNLIRVKCVGGCNQEYEVNPIHVRKVEGEIRFTCDRCIKSKGRGQRVIDVPRM